MADAKNNILNNKTALGIEFGSTRIKAILVDEENNPIAAGGHEWENRYENGVWTYSLEDITTGLQDCFADLAKDVKEKYDVTFESTGAICISAMMHGYMAFNKAGELMVPFRTWRNTITGQAADELSKLFNFHIPQRWSIAHLYQAILNKEEHVKDIDYVCTLEAYIHWMLTGNKVLGIGDIAGMFPVDSEKLDYDQAMVEKFDKLIEPYGFSWKLRDIFPKTMVAGEEAGVLTEAGAKLLDPTGTFKAGIKIAPPEGDAGTGMVATNAVRKRTGNVSAGTSVFGMVVTEKQLSKPYEVIDMVVTPAGDPVAMVHCNNCTSDLNAWVNLFKEFAESMGMTVDMNQLFSTLYTKALEGDKACSDMVSYNYFSGEHVTGFDEGRPLFVRTPNSEFNLANFMRMHIMSSLSVLKSGMDILFNEEHVEADKILGHGGLFKTKGVGQGILAAAINAPVAVMETAGEGGAWGAAILASYMINKADDQSLADYLDEKVFANAEGSVMEPDQADVDGFNEYIKRYSKGLAVERAAVENV